MNISQDHVTTKVLQSWTKSVRIFVQCKVYTVIIIINLARIDGAEGYCNLVFVSVYMCMQNISGQLTTSEL